MSNWVCKRFIPNSKVFSSNNEKNGVPIGAPFLCLVLCVFLSIPAHADSRIPSDISSFDQYISDAYKHVKANSLPRTDDEIRLNLPFQLVASSQVPYRGRFLLFHGLNDSPFIWRDFAAEIASRGFDVRAILFEGHGSTPVEMLNVSYKSWLKSARQHRDDWLEEGTPLYLGGFSMGGVIATLLALEQPEQTAGLLLVSPAFHSRLNRYLIWSGIYSKFKPWVFGGMILEDNPIKYNSIPINSAAQYYKVSQMLKHRWRDRTLNIPVLLVASANDSVVDVSYTQRLFKRRFKGEANKIMLLYHNAAEGLEFPVIDGTDAIELRNAYFPNQRIINQSHLSMINRPENNLFGEAGRILVCNGNEYPVFMACMRAQKHWYGAQHTALPAAAKPGESMARTTYNPDFQVILERFETVFLTGS